MAGGGREATAHVSGQEGRSRESCASRQIGSHDSQIEGRCHPSAESWTIACIIGHASTDAPDEYDATTWADACSGNECGIEWVR